MSEPTQWRLRPDAAVAERYRREGLWTGVTLADCAGERLRDMADAVAAIDRRGAVSFGQLHADAVRLAAQLAARGLQPGDVLSFQLPNWREAMVINLAACIGGFICNPIIPIYRDAEVGYILRHSRARIFFIPSSFRNMDYLAMIDRLRPGLPDLQEVVVVGAGQPLAGRLHFETLLEPLDGAAAPARVDPDAVKLLLFTSGTTGDPKGVLHTHNTIRAELDAVIRFWSIARTDVVLMPSPVTHITGYLYALELAFAAGVKVVLMDKWDAAEAWTLVDRHGATFTIAATPFLIELSAEVERRGQGLPTLRLFGSGGAPVPPAVVARAREALPACQVFRVYGSSEAPTVSLGVREGDPQELGGSTDGAIFNHEVRIVDPATGAVVPAGSEGEIITRGPEVMLGYTRADFTAEAFDAEGFFHTGDLGYVDDRGYLTISGRRKDLIIRGGENISPKEIEDALHRHPAIQEAAVVAMPHERLGETPCAFIVTRPGQAVDLAAITRHLEEARLARQKFPQRIFVRESLPRTASGKVLKHVLRQEAASAVAGSTGAATE